jgi:hypothetical protein
MCCLQANPDYHRVTPKLNMHFLGDYVRTESEKLVQFIHQKPALRPDVK